MQSKKTSKKKISKLVFYYAQIIRIRETIFLGILTCYLGICTYIFICKHAKITLPLPSQKQRFCPSFSWQKFSTNFLHCRILWTIVSQWCIRNKNKVLFLAISILAFYPLSSVEDYYEILLVALSYRKSILQLKLKVSVLCEFMLRI